MGRSELDDKTLSDRVTMAGFGRLMEADGRAVAGARHVRMARTRDDQDEKRGMVCRDCCINRTVCKERGCICQKMNE